MFYQFKKKKMKSRLISWADRQAETFYQKMLYILEDECDRRVHKIKESKRKTLPLLIFKRQQRLVPYLMIESSFLLAFHLNCILAISFHFTA